MRGYWMIDWANFFFSNDLWNLTGKKKKQNNLKNVLLWKMRKRATTENKTELVSNIYCIQMRLQTLQLIIIVKRKYSSRTSTFIWRTFYALFWTSSNLKLYRFDCVQLALIQLLLLKMFRLSAPSYKYAFDWIKANFTVPNLCYSSNIDGIQTHKSRQIKYRSFYLSIKTLCIQNTIIQVS